MKHAHILDFAMRTPWAVLDSTYASIVDVLARCEAGERYSEEQIRAVVGERKERPQPYMLPIGSASEIVAAKGQAKPMGGAVAVLPVYGIIAPRVANLDISEGGTGIDALMQQFRQALANPEVKAIVFDFDTPGGSVYGVDEAASEIFAAREQKRIVAQINPLSASAGFYLATQCTDVVMTPSGEAGSIGVRMMHKDISKALEMRGVKVTTLIASIGPYKAEGSPFGPLSEEAEAFQQQRLDEYGDAFLGAVARGRGVTRSEAKDQFGGGRVFGAAEAKRRGMVDRIATLDETLARLGVGGGGRVAISALAEAAGSISASAEIGAPGSIIPSLLEFLPPAVTGANPVLPTATAEITEGNTMDPTQATAAAGAAGNENVVLDRVLKITRLAHLHNIKPATLEGWMSTGASLESVQTEILSGMAPRVIAQPPSDGASVATDVVDKMPASLRVARMLRCVAGASRSRMTPAAFARDVWKDHVTAGYFAATQQDASTVGGGGFLIPDNLSTDVIELLRPMSVVRRMNPSLGPLVNGTLTVPKVVGGASASYIGESKPLPKTAIKGGQVKAIAKKLGAIVVISNDLLRYTGNRADEVVRTDMLRAVSQAEDLNFLRGVGTEYSPKGIRNWAPTGNLLNATAGQVLASVVSDLGRLWTQLANANVKFFNPGYLFAPRTFQFLFNLLSANGTWVFRDELLRGTLNGYPFAFTSQIPNNLNTGIGSESEIYFADFADVMITDGPTIGVEVSQEAAIDNGDGTYTAIFSNDQTALRMIFEHDLIVRHPESIAVMQQITWT